MRGTRGGEEAEQRALRVNKALNERGLSVQCCCRVAAVAIRYIPNREPRVHFCICLGSWMGFTNSWVYRMAMGEDSDSGDVWDVRV